MTFATSSMMIAWAVMMAVPADGFAVAVETVVVAWSGPFDYSFDCLRSNGYYYCSMWIQTKRKTVTATMTVVDDSRSPSTMAHSWRTRRRLTATTVVGS